MSQPPQDRHDPEDIDRRFREIVEGLRGPERPVPGEGEGGGRAGPGGAAPAEPGPSAPAEPTSAAPVRPVARAEGPRTPEGMATDHRSYSPPESEDDDHFVPPPPPPLPAGDLHFWAIVAGLVLGPLLVVLSAVLPVLDDGWTTVGAVLTLVGFLLLVLRLPRHRGEGDWGARV
ncbi:hypothetical protein [Ornithinimicrobium cerasi]|uniref:hypothetical protein n=1 Tax=Ornithinimicrobium cerasi TaxID=2248773 RepID=UPI000BE34136|nr:hypothetical protein [Ornithinimicrobium cerasi]